MSTPAPTAAVLLRTLGDETRLQLLSLLRRREFCVCELVDLFPISQPAVSGHLRRLKDAGLVRDDRRGMWVYYRACATLPPLAQRILEEVALPPELDAVCGASAPNGRCAAMPVAQELDLPPHDRSEHRVRPAASRPAGVEDAPPGRVSR